MNAEQRELESLRTEVKALRGQVKELREFVRALYAMMNEDQEYEGSDFVAGADYGNT